ncbi:MAG TPA: single-stranded-DNA-specific exonuclease RecJ, partial [Kofleriaceae bacterium]|nr:single-stranded-DNA-specific exonuclease RecJ [Kofleriaceae bacterium]
MEKLGWTIRDVHGGTVSALSAALGVRPVTARCLAGRGIVDPALARSYLEPRLAELRPPAGLAGLSRAVDRLCRAICAGERIGCFGDYDVDGVTTTALVTGFLRALGVAAIARVARREAGYGFGEEDARWFADKGATLVVTGDCGTSDVAAIKLAGGLGLDVIVIDHHTVPPAPDNEDGEGHPAFALINPLRNDSTFPFRGMASVGLAFYVMQRVRTRLRELGFFNSGGAGGSRPEPDLREWLDLVAIGTIADLVPLSGENRILTHAGLRRLDERRRPGLAALMARAGVGLDQVVDERVVGWKLAPRLNAPGRLGDAEPALALLLAEDRGAAEAAADVLERANLERRAEQDRVTAEAMTALDQAGADPGPALVVAGRGWPSGVVGIVAARLVDLYRRPAFVIAIDPESEIGRGSARATAGINLYRALERAAPHLVRYGGHAAAAGLTVAAAEVPALREALCAAVAEQAAGMPASERAADAEVQLGDVDETLAGELASLAPFGKGNEQPVLIGRGLRVRDSRRVGDGSHLRLVLEGAGGAVRGGIAFGMGDHDP